MKKENINDFRSEIFKLCNEIKKNDSLHIIQETLEKLFMCENIEEKIPSSKRFGSRPRISKIFLYSLSLILCALIVF